MHSDAVGPFRMECSARAKYFVTFIDDTSSTRWCEVYFGVFEDLRLYQKLVKRQTGKKIKWLQSDNGREYCNNEFDRHLVDQDIRLTVPRTPQQNGVAERIKRTRMDMRNQSGLSASL